MKNDLEQARDLLMDARVSLYMYIRHSPTPNDPFVRTAKRLQKRIDKFIIKTRKDKTMSPEIGFVQGVRLIERSK